jgi:hypothetical protein
MNLLHPMSAFPFHILMDTMAVKGAPFFCLIACMLADFSRWRVCRPDGKWWLSTSHFLACMQTCRKIVGKQLYPLPGLCPAQAADLDVENQIFEQLQNAAGAVHDDVCRERIIAFEAAAAAAPVVVSLAPEVPAAPKIGENLPAVPQVRGLTLDTDMRLEDVVEDGAKAARVHLERARMVSEQLAANARVQGLKLARNAMDGFTVRSACARLQCIETRIVLGMPNL